MKTDELKILIEAAEGLGHKNIDVKKDQSRDGQESHIEASGQLFKTKEGQVILLIC